MGSNQFINEAWLASLDLHLTGQGYSYRTRWTYLAEAKRFLDYLAERHRPVREVTLQDVSSYMRRELRRLQASRTHTTIRTRLAYSAHESNRMLLRQAQGQWPPTPVLSTPLAAFHWGLCREYASWLAGVHGLATGTISSRQEEARRFMAWLGERATQENITHLSTHTVDSYIKFRTTTLCRHARKALATELRSFLKYLHLTGCISHNLAASVLAPKLYNFEDLPSALSDDEIRRVIRLTHEDHSVQGIRDYAIVMLLSTYGLRDSEVTHLRLEDIDWRHQTLRILRTKVATESVLPLLVPVGEAILAYLRNARPHTTIRELFLRSVAPYRPLCNLYQLVRTRITEAGIVRKSKWGSHAFRHGRAIGLLRAGVPTKQIADVLGHHSVTSTNVYLRLATEDLRAVALEIPEDAP